MPSAAGTGTHSAMSIRSDTGSRADEGSRAQVVEIPEGEPGSRVRKRRAQVGAPPSARGLPDTTTGSNGSTGATAPRGSYRRSPLARGRNGAAKSRGAVEPRGDGSKAIRVVAVEQ